MIFPLSTGLTLACAVLSIGDPSGLPVQCPQVDACAGEQTGAAVFTPRSVFERTADFSGDPVPEIQFHLARAIELLEAGDVSALSPEVRQRRALMVNVLAEYASDAVFPVNRLGSVPTPIFIDGDGRACAVGHLMIRSGAADLAQRIRAESNLAYIHAIEVPGTLEWMRSVGLSIDECALIQPSYGPCPGGGPIHSGSLCAATTPNSMGLSATLLACGSTVASDNNLLLLIDGLPQGSVGYFLNALDASSAVQPGSSQGTLCLSGAIGRHDADIFTAFQPHNWAPFFGPGWWSGIGADLSQLPTPLGLTTVTAGDTWYFQAWYRDVNPSPTSNLSDVIFIAFS